MNTALKVRAIDRFPSKSLIYHESAPGRQRGTVLEVDLIVALSHGVQFGLPILIGGRTSWAKWTPAKRLGRSLNIEGDLP